MQLTSEFKEIISHLSHAEKDKLLFRLLKKDPDLCQRLQFELVEQGDTLQERRDAVVAAIEKQVKYEPTQLPDDGHARTQWRYYPPRKVPQGQGRRNTADPPPAAPLPR